MMEPRPGFEPEPSGYKAEMLAVNTSATGGASIGNRTLRLSVRKSGPNHRPRQMVLAVGIEPT